VAHPHYNNARRHCVPPSRDACYQSLRNRYLRWFVRLACRLILPRFSTERGLERTSPGRVDRARSRDSIGSVPTVGCRTRKRIGKYVIRDSDTILVAARQSEHDRVRQAKKLVPILPAFANAFLSAGHQSKHASFRGGRGFRPPHCLRSARRC